MLSIEEVKPNDAVLVIGKTVKYILQALVMFSS